MANNDNASMWINLAKCMKYDTSPTRPTTEDAMFVRHHLLSLQKPRHGILLGVTKELSQLANADISIIAVDKSVDMIEHYWIGNDANRTVLVGDWLNLPSMHKNMDFVIGDGVFTVLERKSAPLLMEGVKAVLRAGGLFVVRLFCRPEVPETFEAILQKTSSNLAAFRWRLAHSLCDANDEVFVKDILTKFRAAITPADITHFGWTQGEVSIIEAYENLPFLLTFLTEKSFIELCHQHNMEIVDKFTGSYELSELCPTFVLRKI